ncbi:MAG: protoporphyrinogen oxidase [Flavobacteriaceae bacterium]|nr:protoporphyrinogen oxidase [Flavobacteriaceae bacterium]
MSKHSILVLGAGISGLTTAFLLQKKGFDVTILEKRDVVGGCIRSENDQNFPYDLGPNSILDTVPLIRELVADLNLEDQLLNANEKGNKRYILKDDKLHALPTSAKAFLQTRLFSTAAKLRLLKEPFVGRSHDGYYQSIADFVKRRLGQEFLDYAINPFVAGVYAGRPEKLSVASAFPKLYALEEKYGGLFVGAFKSARERKKRAEKSKQSAAMISFKNGVQTLPNAMAAALDGHIHYGAQLLKISQDSDGYKVSYLKEGKELSLTANAILSTIPAHPAASVFEHLDTQLSSIFKSIVYPPVLVYVLAYKKTDIGQALDGFGFLIPEKEKKSFLGAIWNSVIFPDRYDNTHAVFTLFVGGARSPEILHEDVESIKKRVRQEFESLMKIENAPVFENHKMWESAIPQYNLGYIENERYFDAFEKKFPGIFLGGNYRGGISVGDSIKNAGISAEKIESFLSK